MQERTLPPVQGPPATPPATADGLPRWWCGAMPRVDREEGRKERGGTDTAAAAEEAATMLRVIVNVRINGKEVKVYISSPNESCTEEHAL